MHACVPGHGAALDARRMSGALGVDHSPTPVAAWTKPSAFSSGDVGATAKFHDHGESDHAIRPLHVLSDFLMKSNEPRTPFKPQEFGTSSTGVDATPSLALLSLHVEVASATGD